MKISSYPPFSAPTPGQNPNEQPIPKAIPRSPGPDSGPAYRVQISDDARRRQAETHAPESPGKVEKPIPIAEDTQKPTSPDYSDKSWKERSQVNKQIKHSTR